MTHFVLIVLTIIGTLGANYLVLTEAIVNGQWVTASAAVLGITATGIGILCALVGDY